MRESIAAKMIERGYAELVGGGDPIINGDLNFALLDRLLSLSPDMRVLDFGCGCGRLALPLLEYLNDSGHYLGIDIIQELVQFCRQEIAPHYSNSEFLQLAASNSHYKKWLSNSVPPEFGIKTMDSVADASFDLAVAFSVFTHLKLLQVDEYLRHFSRILRPGGQLVFSSFLINSSSRHYLRQGVPLVPFGSDVFKNRSMYISSEHDELAAVAFNEVALLDVAQKYDLHPISIVYGNWCGKPSFTTMQDVVVLKKTVTLPSDFDPAAYVKENPDLPWKTSDSDCEEKAKQHYLLHGFSEARKWN